MPMPMNTMPATNFQLACSETSAKMPAMIHIAEMRKRSHTGDGRLPTWPGSAVAGGGVRRFPDLAIGADVTGMR